jgi:hypothetical protein
MNGESLSDSISMQEARSDMFADRERGPRVIPEEFREILVLGREGWLWGKFSVRPHSNWVVRGMKPTLRRL